MRSNELKLQQEKRLNEKVTAKDIDEVYRRMTRLYGHRFTSNFGETDDGTWLMALSGLKRSDLSRGLTALLKTDDDWPPSVPRFRQMCMGEVENQLSKASHKEYVSIAPINTSPDDAKKNISELRCAISKSGILIN